MANNARQMTDKQWDTIIALHNTAPFRLVRAAAPYFRVKDGEPRNIINISSTSGVNGNAYGVRKESMRCLTNRYQRTSQLWPRKSRRDRVFEGHSQRMGPLFWGSCKHVSLPCRCSLSLSSNWPPTITVSHSATSPHALQPPKKKAPL